MPLVLPWANEVMKIGTPLVESSKGAAQFRFGNESAFSSDSLHSTPLIFDESCAGQLIQATVAGSSHSHRDLSLDVAGSIGGSVMGSSARGQFSKNSAKDESLNKASVHLSFRCGRVTLAHFPNFSQDAIHMLTTANDSAQAFSDRFGDYFVGGYLLGGTNSTFISAAGASQASSERLDISFEVHLLFLSYDNSIHRSSATFSSGAATTLTTFDSVLPWAEHVEALDYKGYRKAIRASQDNRHRAAALQERVGAKMGGMNLSASGTQLP